MTDIDDLVGKEFGGKKAKDCGEFHDIAAMLKIHGKLTEDDKNFLRANGVPNIDNGNGKASSNRKKKENKSKKSTATTANNNQELQQQQNQKRRKDIVCYKYSRKGKSSLLHEAIILAGKPVFITYDNNDGELQVVKNIKEEEADRILKPPYQEECPYESYEFENLKEIQHFVTQAKSISSIGQLYLKAKEIVQKYNDQDNDKLVLIALDIIFSYFQDKFATTHYDSIVGDNDSGKSSLGMTFEALAYRPVYMTDPRAANIFRCLGTVEPGQCTIILQAREQNILHLY
jgi:hypothetical protein